MSCIFCAIIREEIPASVVTRTHTEIVFLDKSPLFLGHCLVVPLDHHRTLPDLPKDLIEPFFVTVRNIAETLPRALQAHGSFVAMNNVISQSVPHLHAHVVPRRPKDGLRGFFWPRTKYRDRAHMDEVAATITEAL